MSLRRRVMLFLLISAPLVWGGGLVFVFDHTRLEIDEFFDTQQVYLARHTLALLPSVAPDGVGSLRPAPAAGGNLGAAALDEFSITVWSGDGRLLLADDDGVQVPYRRDAAGFVNLTLAGKPWRSYYLSDTGGRWHVAVGQLMAERDELVQAVVTGQLLPWVLTLPVLLLVMAAALRQALQPLARLSGEIAARASDDLRALPEHGLPSDLRPLVAAMNQLLQRVGQQVERERRFNADVAHELRTPLAALQAQWDAVMLATPPGQRAPALAKVGEGLDRLGRLVTQMLWLARVDHLGTLAEPQPIDWPALVEQLFSELLPLAARRKVELACEWPAHGQPPASGDPALMAVLLRNLLDNALHHAPAGSTVLLRLQPDAIEVIDEGPGVPAALRARLGERFFRSPEAGYAGSGLGLSIVQRIAALHGLRCGFANLPARRPARAAEPHRRPLATSPTWPRPRPCHRPEPTTWAPIGSALMFC